MNAQALSTARKNLSKLVQSAQEEGTQYTITVNGDNAAMLMAYDDYESLIETLYLLQDKEALKELALSEKQIKKGELISFEEIKKKHGYSDLHKTSPKRVRKAA